MANNRTTYVNDGGSKTTTKTNTQKTTYTDRRTRTTSSGYAPKSVYQNNKPKTTQTSRYNQVKSQSKAQPKTTQNKPKQPKTTVNNNVNPYNLAGTNYNQNQAKTPTREQGKMFVPETKFQTTYKPETQTRKRSDFATDSEYENYLLDNRIDTTKGDALDYITSKASEQGVVPRQYIEGMRIRNKNLNDTTKIRDKIENGGVDSKVADRWTEEVNNRYGVIVDKDGNEVDPNKYVADIESVNKTATDINKQLESLYKDFQNGKIDYETYQMQNSRLTELFNQNAAKGDELNTYQTLQGFDYYDWAKAKGKDVSEFESYVESFNDWMPERLAEMAAASWVDTLNIPIQTLDIVHTVFDPEYDFTKEDSMSSQLTSTANQIREYALGGANGFEQWTTQCVGSLMPMINSMLVGSILPMDTETFTNVSLGIQSGAETVRQRLDQGASLPSAMLNGVIHGTITAMVEAINAGQISNLVTGDYVKYLSGLGMFAKASPKVIAQYLAQTAFNEGTEEVVEDVTDFLADSVQNFLFGGLIGNVEVDRLDPMEMGNEFVMAAVGTVLLGGATGSINNVANFVVNSKQRYNAAMTARTHFESVLANDNAMESEKDLAKKCIEVIDYGMKANDFKNLSQLADAVDLKEDIVEPVASYEEMMNHLCNSLQLDVQEQVGTAMETIAHADNIRNNLQESLLEKGINMPAEDFINANEKARAQILTTANSLNKGGVPSTFTSMMPGQNGMSTNEGILLNTDQTRTIKASSLANLDEKTYREAMDTDVEKIFDEAGDDASITSAASHEVTHFAERSGQWKKLRDMVKDTMGEDKFNTLVTRLGEIYESRGINDANAEHEAVAFFIQENFGSAKFLSKLATYNTSAFTRLYDNVKALFSGDAKTKLENTFERALRKSINTQVEEADALREEGKSGYVGENFFSPSGAQMSIAQYDATGRDILKGYLKNSGLSEDAQTDLLDRMEEAYAAMKKFTDTGEFPTFSKWQDTTYDIDKDGNFSVVISNGDYDLNIDFSTVCKKRKMMDKVLNELSRQGYLTSTKLAPAQLTALRKVIDRHGFEVACGLCFVDAKRFNQGNWAGRFESKWNGLIDQIAGLAGLGEDVDIKSIGVNSGYDADPTLAELDLSDPRFDSFREKYANGSSEEAKMARAILNNPDLRAYVSTDTMYGSEGFELLKENKPKLYDLANASGGSSKPKLAHTEVLYNNEIVNSSNFNPEDAARVGGVRFQSFSDFMTNMVFDYIQAFADMEAKGLTGHSYTKVKEYALLFGKTGMKINLSIIPAGFDPNVYTSEQLKDIQKNDKKLWKQLRENAGLDADGNYIFDKESFDWDLALEIQNLDGYDKNVGTICVGVSDKHIWKMLDDDNVKMIIPYHRSGINPEVAGEMGIAVFNDYTLKQNTRFANKRKVGKGFDFDFYSGSDVNGTHFKGMIENNYDARKTAEAYLDWCEANNYIPKFDTFKDHPNYYKLLVDFRAYDKNGNVSPQNSVKISGDGMSMDSVLIDPEANPKLAEIYGDDIGFNNVLQKGLDVYQNTENEQDNSLDEITQDVAKELGLKKENAQYSLGQTTENSDGTMSGEVTDKGTLDFLNNQDKVKVYRAMAIVDGKLVPPMSVKVRNQVTGKYELRDSSEIGKWYRSEERPDLIKDGKYNLKKDQTSSVSAAYNPYFHTSLSVLNDQFSSAYSRPNMVVVEGEVPVSELSSNYTAPYAKDSVGKTEWHSGSVSSQLKNQGKNAREVILSRWFKPTRVLSDGEVAERIKDLLSGTDIEIPFNVVTPGVRSELEKLGIPIGDSVGLKEQLRKGDIQYSIGGTKGLNNLWRNGTEEDIEKYEKAMQLREDARQMREELNEDGTRKYTEEQILKKTGWFIPDYEKGSIKERFEFYDDDLIEKLVKYVDSVKGLHKGYKQINVVKQQPTIGDVIGEDSLLLKMYPELKNVNLVVANRASSTAGFYNNAYKVLEVNKKTDIGTAWDDKQFRDTLAHEIQHFIQYYEGFTVRDYRKQPYFERPGEKEAWKVGEKQADPTTRQFDMFGDNMESNAEQVLDQGEESPEPIEDQDGQQESTPDNNGELSIDTEDDGSDTTDDSGEDSTEPGEDVTPQQGEDNILDATGDESPVTSVTPGKESGVAQILDEMPEARTQKEKRQRLKEFVKSEIIDHLYAVRELARKLKNDRINAFADFAMLAPNLASQTITNKRYDLHSNKVTGESLNDIIGNLSKEQKHTFAEYLYHMRNIDHLTMETRLGEEAKNKKGVFGESIGVDDSNKRIGEILSSDPWVKERAARLYEYLKQDRQLLVESGVISKAMNDYLEKAYPHYVPIQRNKSGYSGVDPLDPNKVLKGYKGSTLDILPLENTLIRHTNNAYRTALSNNLHAEIMKSAGNFEQMDADDIAESLDNGFNPLEENPKGKRMYAYRNGKKYSMPVSDELYKSLTPPKNPFGLPNVEALKNITEFRRNLITGWNPLFTITNGIKDIQDAFVNTKYLQKYPVKYAEAWAQIAKKGEFYQLYVNHGGGQNSYVTELGDPKLKNDNVFKKALNVVVSLNEAVEMAPRLAEFMATLEDGKTLEEAMYNAAEVTTNFKRGGDTAKYINRNGAAFLNASIQGFDKQMRNLRDAKDAGLKGLLTYAAKVTLVGGLPLYILNHLIWRDDKDYEELSDYVKDNYYIIPNLFSKDKKIDGKFLRIPKGRVAAFYQTVLQNGVDTLEGKVKLWDALLDDFNSFKDNVAPNTISDNFILSPLIDAARNKTWYGDDLIPSRLQDVPDSEQYDETIDSLSIALGKLSKEVADKTGMKFLELSPYKVNYVMDQYSGALGDVLLPMMTQKTDVGINNKIVKGLASPILDKFTTDPVLKNQNVADFYSLKEEINRLSNSRYATDEQALANKYLYSISSEMGKLYAQKREIQGDKTLTNKEKYEQVRAIQNQINALAKEGLANYDQIDITGSYATVGGVQYYKREDGTWVKPSKSQLESLSSANLSDQDKSAYYETFGDISKIREDIKAKTPKGQNADYTHATIDAITNSKMSYTGKNTLFDSYYSGKFTDHVNGMDLTDEQKYNLKVANKYAEGKKDENGKTISNSKAEATAQAYADLGLLDAVLKYIKDNDIAPSEMGLSKTVYNRLMSGSSVSYQNSYNKSMSSGNKSKTSGSKRHSHSHHSSGSSKKTLSKGITPYKMAKTPDVKFNNKLSNPYLNAYSRSMSSTKTMSSPQGRVVCPKCGANVPSSYDRCPNCGTKL